MGNPELDNMLYDEVYNVWYRNNVSASSGDKLQSGIVN